MIYEIKDNTVHELTWAEKEAIYNEVKVNKRRKFCKRINEKKMLIFQRISGVLLIVIGTIAPFLTVGIEGNGMFLVLGWFFGLCALFGKEEKHER